MDIHNRMLFGSHIDAVAAILEPLDIDVIGLNCSTGPDEMEAPIEFLGKSLHLPVSCLPNAGMPEMQGDDCCVPIKSSTLHIPSDAIRGKGRTFCGGRMLWYFT